MSQNYGNPSKPFLTWVLANVLGFGVLGLLSLALPAITSGGIPFLAAVVLAVPVSLAQWLALRRFTPISSLWILTIPGGLLLWTAIVYYQVIPEGLSQYIDGESVSELTLGFLIIGFIIGLPQWPLLQRRFSLAPLWLVGSACGLGFGFWLVLASDLINRSGIAASILVVLVYTLTTGLILVGLLAYQDRARTRAAHAA